MLNMSIFKLKAFKPLCLKVAQNHETELDLLFALAV